MPINLNALQQQRRDTASNWTSNNPTLLAGEWGIETDTKKFKIGDGTTAWQSLDYVPIPDVNRLLTGNLTVGGNFTVNGTTTTIDTTTLTVEDKNIEIGKVTTPTDTTADGGGITLKGATDKTFNWLDATDSWTSSENIAIPDNKNFTAGDNQDLQLFHNGTRSEIKSLNVNNFTIRQQFANGFMFIHANQLQLRSHSTNQLYVSCVNNGSVSLFHANVKKVETTADGVDVQGQIHVLGTVPQLRLNSDTNDGSTTRAMLGMATSANNFVNGSAVNDVILNCPKDFIISHGTTEIMAVFRDDGGVELYYDNAKKAETTADGFQIEDNLTISSDTPKLIFDQTSSNVKYKIEEGSGLLQLKISQNGGVSYASAISIGGIGNIFIPDNDKVNFGSGNDLVIVHDGSDSKITNKTGNLLIEAKNAETGIKIIPDGSVELYHDNVKKAETTAGGVDVFNRVRALGSSASIHLNTDATGANTSTRAMFGIASSTNTFIIGASTNDVVLNTPHRFIVGHGSTEIMAIFDPDGSVELYHDNVKILQTQSWGTHVFGSLVANGDIKVNQTSGRLRIGENDEFTIRHNNTHLFAENTVGNLHIRPKTGEEGIKLIPDGAVELYHDNVKKAETSADGLKIDSSLFINSGSGTLQALRFHNDITGTGINDGAAITYSTNSHGMFFSTNESAGNMVFQTGGFNMNNRTLLISQIGVVTLQRNQELMLVATPNAGVELYHDAVKKLETTSNGVTVSGNLLTGNFTASTDGNTSISLLDSGHGFPQSEIKLSNGGRDLNIVAPKDIRLFPQSGENGIVLEANGQVELYHDNVKKVETTSSGVTVTGSVTASTGILFGSDTADANTLDDYEEGTWTPTVVSEGTIGTPQFTCTYTKIGRLVTINADIHQLSDTTSSTHIKIGGLPYVPSVNCWKRT